MAVRREVAVFYREQVQNDQRRLGMDRVGTALFSGGDYDLAFCACDLGLGIGMFHRLVLTHLMPEERFELDYLVRLSRSIHMSGKILRSFRTNVHREAPRTFWQRLRRLARRLSGQWNDERFQIGLAAEQGLRDADGILGL